MIKEFIQQLEKRASIDRVLSRFGKLFTETHSGPVLSSTAFNALTNFIRSGDPSFHHLAAQIGVRWSAPGQKIVLRNALAERGLTAPACLWAHRRLRGAADELLKEYESPDMA